VVLVLSKGAIVAALCLLVLRYPARTAALAGLGLAQSAEFSFILARQGVEAGAVSGDVFSLIIAATAATTIIAPSLYRFEPALESALTRLSRSVGRKEPDSEAPRPMRNHVVICGAGRVGSVITEVLRQRRHGYIVIETDWRLTQALRAAGEPVLYGDAAAQAVLARAHLAFARTLVVALPDPVTTRRVVDAAKEIHPRLDIVVRASSGPEAGALLQRGVAEAVIPEREVALEMTRHTLQRIGVPTLEAQALLQRLRHDVPSRRDGGE
jgi:CPA2 family monovalent cation:H+ antiporter-2